MINVRYELPYIVISGDTYPQKEVFRFLRFIWDTDRKIWKRYAKGDFVIYYLNKLKNIVGENNIVIDDSIKVYDKPITQEMENRLSYILQMSISKKKAYENGQD
jgi:hypothetical protein